ncbi:TRAP transporter substrate-binding protein [Rubrimonas cliftonensis]|uniref:TRAP-type C4-dicarboxylate transport system, substrate-binding protein n=1 Tax=Rubrimonas cliftonensis TaxID=89524 RepID=A0A1H3WYP1_9RHOB|nr:TRAP transporter substrate-binding protein [Rubrimonas cliftonensis]SDZ91348.1 TRAP-type C4-dicarboxylate transport system, substrate-binding protein [Rubrimonas cliftonensis]
MTTTRRTTLAALGLGALGLGAMLAATPALAETRWDLSTVWPDGNFHTINAKRFAEEVSAATGGEVVIEVRSGGQLGFKGPEHLRAVRDGLVPMADVLNIQQVGDEPVLGAEGVPFLVSSADELRALHRHLRPVYEAVAARNNQKILYMVPWPTQYLHMKAKAESLDALADTKVRAPDKNAADMLDLAGMAGVLIPWGEVVPALASGAVSGVSTSAVSGVDGKFWEFLDYVYPTNHVWSSQMVTVNLDAWAALTPERQAAVEAVAARLEPEFWETSVAADGESLDKLKAGGMQVVEIPAPMMAEFRARTASMLEDFLARVPEAEAPVRAYLADLGR